MFFLEEIVELFIKMEYEKSLFNLKINGISIWPYIRHDIFQDILCFKDIRAYFPYNYSVVRKSDSYINQNINTSIQNSDKDFLIVPHGRKFRNKNGAYKCIYTDLLIKALGDKACVLDYGDVFKGFLPDEYSNVIRMDIERLKREYEVAGNTVQRLEEDIFEKSVVNCIEHTFDICTPQKIIYKWKRMAWNAIFYSNIYRLYYELILKQVNPKVIVIVCYYSTEMMALCEVAKDFGIPVIELQHGEINNLVIDYNFLNLRNPAFFPDYVFLFGDMEKTTRFPLQKEKTISVGFPEMESKVNLMKDHNNDKVVLFISSMQIELAECATKVARRLKRRGYRIQFKLHPLELYNWKQIYGDSLDYKEVDVIDTMDVTVHDCFNRADWVVGTISSALFEATMFPVKIAILPIGEYTYLSSIYKNDRALLVSDDDELVQKIIDNTFTPSCNFTFFKRNSLHNMIREMEKIAYGE